MTLFLTEVADARAFGAVEMTGDFKVTAFNEKMENPPTNTINAGCYIFNRDVIDQIPIEKVISVERETFPNLLASGARVFGYIDRSYWLDIGNPQALLKASHDLVSGEIFSAATPAHFEEYLALKGAQISELAQVGGYSVIGAGAKVKAGAKVMGCVLNDGAVVGARSNLRNCFIAPNFAVPDATIAEGAFFGF